MRRPKQLCTLFAAAVLAQGVGGEARPPDWAADPCRGFGGPEAAATNAPPEIGVGRPPEALASAAGDLWEWVRQAMRLPESAAAPAVRLVSTRCLRALRRSTGADPLGIEAVYMPGSATVYLQRRWRADSLTSRSILVHEFVHHAQALSARTFACPAAAEKEAYAVQEAWLEGFGLSLEGLFGLDRMTRFILTECGI